MCMSFLTNQKKYFKTNSKIIWYSQKETISARLYNESGNRIQSKRSHAAVPTAQRIFSTYSPRLC